MNTILFATDGSPTAKKAAEEAIELANATGEAMHVVTVWRPPVVNGYGFAPAVYLPELVDIERESAEAVAREAAEAAQAAGVETSWEIREGEASSELCAAAKEISASLIVIGSHGWGAFKRLVFGSVSTAVLHHARCPVLVVRADEGELRAEATAARETVRL
jgi:nucleotide-binding universal stress UspA family protein